MTQCPNCGADVGEQEAVCWNCNASLTEGGATQGGHEEPTNQQDQPPQGQQSQPPQGQYQQGQPPQGQPPQGQYQQGQRPQGQYQQGQPPQGQYQQGQPPQGQPPQGQYGQPPRDDSGIGRRELIAGGGLLAAAGAGGWFFFLRDDGGPGSPEDPGTSFDDAPSVSEGTHGPYEVTDGEEHYFAVDLEQGERLEATIEFQHSEGDLDLRLTGPNRGILGEGLTTNDNETVSTTAMEAGTYYIIPYGYTGATNEYELNVTIESSN